MNTLLWKLQLALLVICFALFCPRGFTQETGDPGFGIPVILDTFTVTGFHWPTTHYTSWSDNSTTFTNDVGVTGTLSGAQGGVIAPSAGKTTAGGAGSGHIVARFALANFPYKGLVYHINVAANATGLYVQSSRVIVEFTDHSTLTTSVTELIPFDQGVQTRADGSTVNSTQITDENSIVLSGVTNESGYPVSSVTFEVQSTFIPNATLANTSNFTNTSHYNASGTFDNNSVNDRDIHTVSVDTTGGDFFHKDGFDASLLTQGSDTVVRGFTYTIGGTQPTADYVVCAGCAP